MAHGNEVQTFQVTINNKKVEFIKKDPYDLAHEIMENISRTKVINGIVINNFSKGAEGYKSISNENAANLLWQVEKNLEQLDNLATEVMLLRHGLKY